MDSVIKSSFWTDTRVEEQPAEIKLAILWLISNPARDLCGFTRISNKRFEFETGLSHEFLEGACKALPSSFQKFGKDTYFAVNFLRHQFGKGGSLSLGNKVIVAAARHGAKLPAALQEAFYAAYPELLEICHNGHDLTSQNEGGSKPHAENRHGVIVRVREGVSKEGSGEIQPSVSNLDVPGIVALYPRREGVMAACSALREHIRKGADPVAIAAGTRAHAAVIAQLPSGGLNCYVESAEKFFRERKWEDDPKARLRSGHRASGGAQAGGALDLGWRGQSGTTIKIQSNKPKK